MRRKYKMTGCARFLIFLLIFTPLVLIGVSLYNGNNPIDQFKDLLNIETTTQTNNNTNNSNSAPVYSDDGSVTKESILQGTIDTQKKEILDLRDQVKKLNEKVKQQEQEIQVLRRNRNNE